MGYRSLYRKWRPQIFKEIIGQEHITQTLINAISLNRIAHAYIFSGPRGVGKTTTARILAKSLNCEKGPTTHPCNVCEKCIRITDGYSMDVIEIDGASNRGIDDIRDLRNKVKFAPAEGKYKVYIIDEVHMLTTEAFNALLKTLEEPPAHVIFIFATTAPHKIPNTILSRCQWFNFRRIPLQNIIAKLKIISKDEGINIDDKAINIIARNSTGSMRDAESALDQVIAYCDKKVNLQNVRDVLGVIEEDIFYDFMEAIITSNVNKGIGIINQISDAGEDPHQFVKNLMEYVHNLSLIKYCTPEALDFREIFPEDKERILKQSNLINTEKLFAIVEYLAEIEKKMIYTRHPWILLEMMVIKFTYKEERSSMIKTQTENDGINENLTRTISNLKPEKKLVKKEIQKKESDLSNKTVQNTEKEKELPAQPFDIYLKKIWPKILDEIKKKRISMYSFITANNSLAIENDRLIIGFNKEYIFHKESLEKKSNKQLLQDLIRKETGEFLIIECVINENIYEESFSKAELKDDKKKTIIENEKDREETVEQKNNIKKGSNKTLEREQLLKKSLNLFNGKIIEE